MYLYSYLPSEPDKVFKFSRRAYIYITVLIGHFVASMPICFGQSPESNLGQSEWQTPANSANQTSSLGQSDWQSPNGSGQNSPIPGLTSNSFSAANAAPSNYSQTPGQQSSLGQSSWQQPANQMTNQVSVNGQNQSNSSSGLGLSGWQQPQSGAPNQNSNSQQNSDFYYGQVNQNQPNPSAFSASQYQGQANYSGQANNQSANNLPPASSIPAQAQSTQPSPKQQSQGGGLKNTLAGVARAAGLGVGIAAPLAGVYMMTRAMTNSYPSYGMGMPYGGGMPYGYGYPGMAVPMSYAAPNYAMMNMAPMTSSAFSGLSSFLAH